jgi:ABC-2 type transport system permease protein
MCLGLLFSKSEAIIISIAFIAFEWLTNIGSLPGALGSLQLINPNYLYAYIICFTQEQLFDTSSSSFGSWFNSMLPYIVLMVAEAIIIVLVSCMLFNREEA